MTKIIDRYVAKNFIVGYLIAFGVLMGLRIVIDLFISLDEFAEMFGKTVNGVQIGYSEVFNHVVTYYGAQAALFFRDFAGMITVVAAAFSLGKMTRSNELTAVLASGVSLKRVIAPIIFLAIFLTGVLIIDQEVIIPGLSDKLVRRKDDIAGTKKMAFWFLLDGQGSLVSAPNFISASGTLVSPTIITRTKIEKTFVYEVTGRITADSAIYDYNNSCWVLNNGLYLPRQGVRFDTSVSRSQADIEAKAIASYPSDLTPRDIPVLRTEQYKSLLSSRQLAALAQKQAKIRDLAQLYSQKHFRITDPIINLIMLMVGLPVLVCREPKMMKSAILKSFTITAACFLITFLCKMIATETMFHRVMPEFWAWMPIFIFLPIALIELDSMKT